MLDTYRSLEMRKTTQRDVHCLCNYQRRMIGPRFSYLAVASTSRVPMPDLPSPITRSHFTRRGGGPARESSAKTHETYARDRLATHAPFVGIIADMHLNGHFSAHAHDLHI